MGTRTSVASTTIFPLIYVPIGFAIFFGIGWFLVIYVFASQPLPFRFFALAGITIGAFSAAINTWRARQPLIEMFRKRS